MTSLLKRLLALGLGAGVLLAPSVAQAAPALPKATAPAQNAKVSALPVLAWKKAARAKSYEIQISSDSGFNPALVDVTTQNLRYLHPKMVPNGTYYWRLRSVDADTKASKWTSIRKFVKNWSNLATLSTPTNLGVISYPNPAILRWSQVPGAATYQVSVATGASGGGVDAPGGIISTGALAFSDGDKPITTSNTNYAVSAALHPGTYYWQIRPVDAEGNLGMPSTISSFVWTWTGTTTPAVTDMVAGVEIYDPLFSWTPIPGAASYQVEINRTAGFAPGSRNLLAGTNATQYAPKQTMPNNTYYWRVRGVDPQGQAGPWNTGPSFDKTYDQTPDPQGPQNLRVYDTKLAGPFATETTIGAVDQPVIMWDTVPGARAYQLSINCNSAGAATYTTANTAWTPLATINGPPPPYLQSPNVSVQNDNLGLVVGCDVLVRALADNAIDDTVVYGPYAALSFFVGGQSPAFSNPPPSDCAIPACAGRLSAANIVAPANGTTIGKSPVLCWKPFDMDPAGGTVEPSRGYWVSIARDPNFTTIVQTAYTPEPCYAPPFPLVDEATLYYWQVVPVRTLSNSQSYLSLSGASGGFIAPAPSFQHASVPPTAIAPVGGQAASGPVVFRWSAVPEQVKTYNIEVAQDDSFSTILESAMTDATSYSATTTYPVGATVYWRVRANNDQDKGLAWSATSSFVQTLPIPTITTPEAFSGETFPALTWSPVDGATGYEVQDVWPDASVHLTSNIPSTAVSYTKMTGTGHGTVQVRAMFPGGFKSAFTPTRDVVHTIGAPQGAHTVLDKKTRALTLAWNVKANAKSYKVQVARNATFVSPVLEDTTDQSAYTPVQTQNDFLDGGLLYWRVAAVDPDGNTGGYSKPVKISLIARMQVNLGGSPAKGVRGIFTITVLTAQGKPLKNAVVKLAGAGIQTITRKTNRKGLVTWSIKPSKRGAIGVRVTLKNYRVGLATVKVS
jgi:hypothetical protein